MQSGYLAFRADKRNERKSQKADPADGDERHGNWVTRAIVLLCDGDITKAEYVRWRVTADELDPWIEYQARAIMPREILIAVAGALGLTGGNDGGCTSEKQQTCQERYGRFFEATCRICPDNKNAVIPAKTGIQDTSWRIR